LAAAGGGAPCAIARMMDWKAVCAISCARVVWKWEPKTFVFDPARAHLGLGKVRVVGGL
jgi:hypothetical protein